MHRSAWIQAGVFIGLIAAGTAVRLVLSDIPNFAPVAAIALFAGYFFPKRGVAALVPLAVMLLSDCFLDGYNWRIRAVVYAMLTLPVLAGAPLRNAFDFTLRSRRGPLFSTGSLVGASLAASVCFFLATNFAVWCFGTMYSRDFSGLMHCYVQALPFFTNTLMGDAAFSLLLFGGFGLAVRRAEWRDLAGVRIAA